MSIYYKKLYTKQITLPFIKWEGCSSDNTDYYAVLEKNYIPVASTETWDTSNGDWVSVGLSPENTKYNKLSITRCSQNDTGNVRTRIFEFRARPTGKIIDPCNSIYAVIRQEPKQVLDAKIEFVPLDEYEQTLNNDSKLIINGDEQLVKIIFYGIRNNVKTLSKTELTINGVKITEYTDNVVSLTKTGNGNTLIYKVPQYTGTGNKTLTVSCTHNGDYGRSASATAYIEQQPNVYNAFKLGISNLSTVSAVVKNNITVLDVYCQLLKNDKPVTNGIKLIFSNDGEDTPYIATGAYTREVLSDSVLFKIPIEQNYTPETRKINIVAQYKDQSSNTVTVTQNKASVIIHAYNNNTEVNGDISIPGSSQIQDIKYYAVATLEDSTTVQYISYKNKLNSGLQNITLCAVPKQDCDIIYDTAYNRYKYQITSINIPENATDSSKQSIVTLKFSNDTVSKDITFNQAFIVLSISMEPDTTSVIHGLSEFNQVYLKFRITEDEKCISDLANIDIDVPEDFYLYNTFVNDNVINYVYNITEDYGLDNSRNGIAVDRQRTCTIKYKSVSSSVTILQHPVYFGVSVTKDPLTTVSGTSGEVAYVYAEGIIYNSASDKTNYITVATDSIVLSDTDGNVPDYITVENRPTAQQYVSILTFDKNDTGAGRKFTASSTFKELSASVTITQASVSLTAKFAFFINDEEVTAPQYMETPWDGYSVSFVAYMIDNDSNVIKNVEKGNITLTLSNNVKLKYTLEETDFKDGKLYYTFNSQKTYLYSSSILTFKYTVTHGRTYLVKTLRLYKPAIYTYKSSTIVANTGTDFYNVNYPISITRQNSNNVRIYANVMYKSIYNSKTYGTLVEPVNKNDGVFTITCDTATKSTVNNVDDNCYNISFEFPDNNTPNEITHTFNISYKNEGYVGEACEYKRNCEKTIKIKQSGASVEVLIAFDNGLTETTKTINGLAHDDVYVYIGAKINDDYYDISSSDISITEGSANLQYESKSNKILKYKVIDANTTGILANSTDKSKIKAFSCKYNSTRSSAITLIQNSVLNPLPGDTISTVVEVDNETIQNNGGTATFTYYFKYNSTVVDIPSSAWTTSAKDENNSNVTMTYVSHTDGKYRYSYTFGVNSSNASHSVEFFAQATGTTKDSKIAIQGAGEISVYLSVNNTSISAAGGTFTLTYYGILNGVKKTGVSIIADSVPSSWSKKTPLIGSNNITTEGWNVAENMSTEEISVQFTATFMESYTKQVTVKQLSNSFSCVLTCENNAKIDGAGETRTFYYYGVRSSGNVTNTGNVTFVCDAGSSYITIGTPTVKDNKIQVRVTFKKNEAGSTKTFKFHAVYTYSTKSVSSNTITLTQKIGVFEPQISFTTDYTDADGNYRIQKAGTTQLKIYYWGKTADNTIINDPALFTEPVFSIFDDDYKTFTTVKTAGPVLVSGKLCCTYSVPSNTSDSEFADFKQNTVTVSLVMDPTKTAETYIVQFGDVVPIPEFDYFAFKYNFTGGGKDFDTATSIRSDLDKDIYEYNDDGSICNRYYVLNSKKYAGYSGGGNMNYLIFYGDNMTESGNEAVTIDVKRIVSNSKDDPSNNIMKLVKNSIYVDILGSWWGTESTGEISITFECYKGTTGFDAYYGPDVNYVDPSISLIPNDTNTAFISPTDNVYGTPLSTPKVPGSTTCEYIARSGMTRVYGPATYNLKVHGKGTSGSTTFRGTYAHFGMLRYNLKSSIYELRTNAETWCHKPGEDTNNSCPFDDNICSAAAAILDAKAEANASTGESS